MKNIFINTNYKREVINRNQFKASENEFLPTRKVAARLLQQENLWIFLCEVTR